MRQLYITCLALSSFFIYSSSLAQAQLNQHAFFIPGNTFQENTTLQEIKPNNTRRPSQNNNSTTQKNDNEDPLASAINPNKKIKKTRPYVKKVPKVVSPKDFKKFEQNNGLEQNEIQLTNTPVSSKYSLDDDLEDLASPKPTKVKKEQKPLSALDLYSRKTVEQMLNEHPRPNKSLPKYKQRAALYNMELRNLYRRGSLPFNQEQEDTLAKATSGNYFSVP